jgi:hypothetical protein
MPARGPGVAVHERVVVTLRLRRRRAKPRRLGAPRQRRHRSPPLSDLRPGPPALLRESTEPAHHRNDAPIPTSPRMQRLDQRVPRCKKAPREPLAGRSMGGIVRGMHDYGRVSHSTPSRVDMDQRLPQATSAQTARMPQIAPRVPHASAIAKAITNAREEQTITRMTACVMSKRSTARSRSARCVHKNSPTTGSVSPSTIACQSRCPPPTVAPTSSAAFPRFVGPLMPGVPLRKFVRNRRSVRSRIALCQPEVAIFSTLIATRACTADTSSAFAKTNDPHNCPKQCGHQVGSRDAILIVAWTDDLARGPTKEGLRDAATCATPDAPQRRRKFARAGHALFRARAAALVPVNRPVHQPQIGTRRPHRMIKKEPHVSHPASSTPLTHQPGEERTTNCYKKAIAHLRKTRCPS